LKIEKKFINEKIDPCNVEAPLFMDQNSLIHKIYDTNFAGNSNASFIDHVFLYNFMYFAIQTDSLRIYKACGPPTSLRLQLELDLGLYQPLDSLNFAQIARMQSLYQYAFYVTDNNGLIA